MTPEQEAAYKEKESKILDLVSHRATSKELRDIRVTLDHMAHPDIPKVELFGRHFIEPCPPNPNQKYRQMHKTISVIKSVERTRNKFPEIFQALRNKDVIDMTKVLVNLKNMAEDESNEAKDRIKASSVLIRAAVDAEKMAMSSEKEKITVDGFINDVDLSDVV